jgi:hypothetical protein
MTFRKADESLIYSGKTVASNLPYYVQKQSITSEFSIRFLYFSNKGSTVIFLYLFSSALFISLHFPFIFALSFSFMATFASLIRIIASSG